ncbi:MAG: DNA-protecting protein DprA [Candidatus Peribacteria bacterium]|jgi:DNA processing protein|nr:DNA-protecting protein DprA [Candidatus Peribacteria bacterium]
MIATAQKVLHYSLQPNLTLGQLKKATTFCGDTEEAQQLAERMEAHHIVGITSEMENYPPKCYEIKRAPYLLYAMGNLALLDQKILGIVGPREMSSYAERVMETFFVQAQGIALTTISGMARGVDHKCHQLSLHYGIPTIAVLGGGLRWYLRSSAKSFIEKIVAEGGLVLSEFKLDFEPTTWSFPQRNRLIAGLSEVLFLPEARAGSGSLITVDFALQMHREVFVAPNQLFSVNGGGSNQLLAEGKATLLSNFEQLLSKFQKNLTPSVSIPSIPDNLTSTEQELFSLVRKFSGKHLSEWEVSSRDFATLLSELTLLELKGSIRQESP